MGLKTAQRPLMMVTPPASLSLLNGPASSGENTSKNRKETHNVFLDITELTQGTDAEYIYNSLRQSLPQAVRANLYKLYY